MSQPAGTPEQVLKEIFGYSSFRHPQKDVIERTLRGGHSLVLMPTGMGKSLCFQIPARLMTGLTVVISPLIALMKDQVDQARQRGFRATFINSSLNRETREIRYRELKEQKYELVYVTPERFRKSEFIEAVAPNTISLLAIDEAHCISEWGHDFRPDYTRMREFRQILREPTILALTATATPQVQKDIVDQLGIVPSEVQVFYAGIERPNLSLAVHDLHGLDSKVRDFIGLQHIFGIPAIVYFSLISTLEDFSRQISKLGVDHTVYHGRLNDTNRRKNQERFLGGDTNIILATPAFGLGIDKPNVRQVIHAEIPGSLEAYYQEAGRAGRDGEDSKCTLLYDQDDVSIQMDFIKWAHPEPSFISAVYNLIERNPGPWKSRGVDFLRQQMNYYNSRDYRVETSVNLLERWGSLENGEIVAPLAPEVLDVAKSNQRLKADQNRLLQMVNYAQMTSADQCRAQEIHRYFGVETGRCGRCDLCAQKAQV